MFSRGRKLFSAFFAKVLAPISGAIKMGDVGSGERPEGDTQMTSTTTTYTTTIDDSWKVGCGYLSALALVGVSGTRQTVSGTAADYAATVAALRANRRDATSQSYKATVTRLIARLESAATN